MHDLKSLIVRIRENGEGPGIGLRFSGDDLEFDDPTHVTALDKLAYWITSKWDNSGPDAKTWRESRASYV